MTQLMITDFGLFSGSADGNGGLARPNKTWLAPAQWDYRTPDFMTRTSPLTGNEDSQAVVDQMMLQAWHCGADALCHIVIGFDQSYPLFATPGHAHWAGFNSRLAFHLTSQYKSLLKYCISFSWGCNAVATSEGNYGTFTGTLISGWPTTRAYYVSLFQDPDYFTVLDGRPLVLILAADAFASLYANAAAAKVDIDSLRAASIAAIGKDPYIVSMGPEGAGPALGFDARSVYTVGPASQGEAAGQAIARQQASWATQAAISPNKIIPSCSTLLDYRPMNGGYPNSYTPPGVGQAILGNWNVAPTMSQFTNHVKAGFDYVAANPSICETGIVNYSYGASEWSEGCYSAFVPNYRDGGAYMQDVARELRRQRMPRRSMRARGIPMVSR